MKKVTKRLLVACVAALSVGACQDQIVIEPPPPPPPPPPGVDATVTIQGLRSIPANTAVNPTAVAGDINVVLNVEEGDNTVTQVDLILDGNPLGCTAISANRTPGENVSLSQAAADEVECFFNTDDVAGECVGDQLDPAFGNGTHTLGARITLDDGTTRTASNTQEITLANTSGIVLVHTGGGQGITGPPGGAGQIFWGGPSDLDGDGDDDNLVQFAACPFSYQGTNVGSVQVQGLSVGGTNHVDLGNGLGGVATDGTAPFVFTAHSDDNEQLVEDPPTPNMGHQISVVGTVIDDGGQNVTSEFSANFGSVGTVNGNNNNFFMDFTAPVVAGGSITLDGVAIVMDTHYSAGDFGLAGVTDGGVGVMFGTNTTLNVNECGTGTQVGVANATPDFADVTAIDDLPEDDAPVDADTNELDCYEGDVTELADLVGNPTDLSVTPIAVSTNFGVDRTAADLDEFQPDPPDGTVILNDVAVMFDAADPDLESGDAGSGVDNTACTAAADGTTCTNITAEDEDGETYEVFEPAAGSFSVDIADVGGAGSNGPLAQGVHTISVLVPDFAVDPNEATADIAFDLDTQAPSFGALNPVPGGSAGTAATSIIQSIGGTITDAHDIVDAMISVFADGTDALGTGGDGTCTTGDYLLDDGAGEIDRNEIDISGTESIQFNESFEIFEPTAASATVTYCFIIEAADGAVDKTGAANPNQSSLATQADVNWLP